MAACSIGRNILGCRYKVLVVPAFVLYMLIPLVIGVRDGNGFFAIREFLPLLFYLLAPVLLVSDFHAGDYRQFANTFLAGVTLAIIAVFAHVMWLLPLPGFPKVLTRPAEFDVRIIYLDWTVPVVALTLGVAGLIWTKRRETIALYTGTVFAVLWYLLATGERFVQVISLSVLFAVYVLSHFGSHVVHRMRILVVVALFIIIAGLGTVGKISWLQEPVVNSALRWQQVGIDDSLAFRLREVKASAPSGIRTWLFGEGLGEGILVVPSPHAAPVVWHYVSNGYAFLLFHGGLIALALYLAGIGYALFIGREMWSRRDTDIQGVLLFGTVGMIALLLLNALYIAADVTEGALSFSLFYAAMVTSDSHVSRTSSSWS